MDTIKIGVVEDEVIIAETIITSLQELGYETTDPCLTYTQALRMIENEAPDIILLDIQLAGKKTGIDVAIELNKSYNIPFIFLTSNSDPKTIAEAKTVNPDAYLVKPFNKEDLYASIEIALANFVKRNEQPFLTESKRLKDTIFLKKKGQYFSVRFDEILFVKSDHVYLEIRTIKDSFLLRSKLEDFVLKLPPQYFLQIHRRYYINLQHLVAINYDSVLINEEEVPLNKIYKAELLKIANLG